MKMNLPNKLTVIRMATIPVFAVCMMWPVDFDSALYIILKGIAAALFIGAEITDVVDGRIARSRQLITNFGKLMDPLADKLLTLTALTVIVYEYDHLRVWYTVALLVVLARELTITSMRSVISSSSGTVIPANKWGKTKTVFQAICISTTIIEPLLYRLPFIKCWLPGWCCSYPPLTAITYLLMMLFTVWSGIVYVKMMWKYIDSNK